MQQNRKDYRKKFTSTGELYLAGELLEFVSYDVSVTGIQIEIASGKFISSVDDIRALLDDTLTAEVFVESLGLSAEAKVAWVLEDEGKILLGLEFIDGRHNATKLWRKRRFYRKNLSMQASFLLDEQEYFVDTIDISTDGMKLKGAAVENLQTGDIIKLLVQEKKIKALAVVIWINSEAADGGEFGVRYIGVGKTG